MARNKRAIAQKTQVMYCEKEKLSINLYQDVSDHATELLWGQGFISTYKGKIKAKERLQELLEYNRAEEMFPDLEKKLSLFGNMYATIDMVDGKPTWTLADPYLNANPTSLNVPATNNTIYGMGRAFVTDVVAVIWKRITVGTISFPIKEVWDKEKVVRYFYGENNKLVTVASVNKKLEGKMTVSDVWNHNMGFVPVRWFKNVPTFGGASYKDGYKGAALQELVNKTLQELWHETETNRTRIIGNLDESSYNQLMRNGELAEINKNDYLINVSFKNSTGTEANTLVPIVADPKFEQYWLSINAAKDEFYKLAGYSPLGDGNTEKTATENLLMKTGDYQTTKKKRNQRMVEILDLIYMTLAIDAKHGYGDIYGDIKTNLVFEIMENKVMDSLQEVNNLNLLVQNDFMSKIEAIAQLRGVEMDEAKEIYEGIIQAKAEEQLLFKQLGLNEEDTQNEDNKEVENG